MNACDLSRSWACVSLSLPLFWLRFELTRRASPVYAEPPVGQQVAVLLGGELIARSAEVDVDPLECGLSDADL